MKKYTCHKTVEAFKIERIRFSSAGGNWLFAQDTRDEGQEVESVHVTNEYIEKHDPHVGGYYVKYADGYESFSPTGPFEAGYTEAE